MPALDRCHSQILRALRKEGWHVDEKPIYIDAERPVYIDIDASRSSNGSENDLHVYIEVKCFPDPKSTQDLYIALGQYIIYRALLANLKLSIPLYLAIPQTIYEEVFNDIIQQAVDDNKIKLLIVDLKTETIVQWNE